MVLSKAPHLLNSTSGHTSMWSASIHTGQTWKCPLRARWKSEQQDDSPDGGGEDGGDEAGGEDDLAEMHGGVCLMTM